MDIINILLKTILGGIAACGFAILFNVPNKSLPVIFGIGSLAICLKSICVVSCGMNLILTSLLCSTFVGIVSVFIAYFTRNQAFVYSIPSIIPMVPGIFIYKSLIGVVKLTNTGEEQFPELFRQTIQNGLNASFILMVLAIGIITPNLATRKVAFYEGAKTHKH